MTWTPRPDWIVVTGTFTYNGVNYHAAGDGVTDDTAALQAALNVTSITGTTSINGKLVYTRAVYLPAGTYLISNTLHWRNFYGGLLVGCGSNTTIQWNGASGAAMFWADGVSWARYIGITWDGRNIASCAYEHVNNNSLYAGRCRHENEAFKNFMVNGTYMAGMVVPAAAIMAGITDIVTGTNTYTIASGTSTTPGVLAMKIGTLVSGTAATPITGAALSGTLALKSGTTTVSGIVVTSGTLTSGTGTLQIATSSTGTVVSGTVAVRLPIETGNTNAPTAEMMVNNCLFQSCSNGIVIGYTTFNDYQWVIDGCEFESCGVGVRIPCGLAHIFDTHFQNSSLQDICTNAGHSTQVRRCTSQNSAQFFNTLGGGSLTMDIIEDCWVDHWTGSTGAIGFGNAGPSMVFDCNFTNPVNAVTPCINLINSNVHYVTASGNYCSNPSVPMITTGATASVVNIPCGSRSNNLGSLSSGSTIFLSATTPYIGDGSASVPILSVTGTNFAGGAKGTGYYSQGVWYGDDDHDAIQAAINQAKANNNGSIVYFPTVLPGSPGYQSQGRGYRINSCLQVSGSNYSIEGGGFGPSYVMWGGTAAGSLALTGTMMAVSSPQNIVFSHLYLMTGTAAFVGGTGAQVGYAPQTGLFVSSTIPCSLSLEEFSLGNAAGYYPGGNGLVLNQLPAGSLVYLERLNSPLVVQDCGQAEILAKHALPGTLAISAPTTANNAKTGFLGLMVNQQGLGTSGSSDWSMRIDDNQELVIGSHYNDGDANHLWIRRGAATGSVTGRVTIQANKDGRVAGTGYNAVLFQMDGYAGRLMYGPQSFSYGTSPALINHTGTNALDLILANDIWGNYVPSITDYGSGLNLIQFQNALATGSTQWLAGTFPAGYGASVAQGFDHLRQMGFEDLKLRYGIENVVTNGGFEADPVNATPLTVMGTSPANWVVSGGTAVGAGVRNLSVVGGGSPFASGTQSASFVDTTGTNIGGRLQFSQNTLSLPATEGAVFTFDVRLNSMTANNDDIWVRIFCGSATAHSIHLTGNSTSGAYGPATLSLNTWYRIRAVVQAPSLGAQNITLYVTPWTVSGPGTTSTYSVAGGLAGPSTSGFTSVQWNAVGAGENANINFDNISITTGDLLLP